MADTIKRSLQLKAIDYAGRLDPKFTRRPIHELLAAVQAKAPTVRRRHHPKTPQTDSEQWHCLYHRYHAAADRPVVIEYCTYLPGTVPVHMRPDLDAADLDLAATPLIDDKTGQPLEVAHAAQVLAFGQVLIVESVRGNGGNGQLARYLTAIIRRHVDPELPPIVLHDVVGPDLHETIERGGGAREVQMDLAHAPTPDAGRFGKLLNPVRTGIRGAGRVRVSWKAQGRNKIPDSDVINAYEEMEEGTGVDGVRVVLNDGTTITGFDRFRLRKQVEVQSTGHKMPNTNELRREMRQYLAELQTVVNGSRVVDRAGRLVTRIP